MWFKKAAVFTGVLVAFVLANANTKAVYAGISTKTQSIEFTYNDTIITSWTVGKITGVYTFSYDSKTKKLINQKDMTYYTSDVALGNSFSDIKKEWSWYDTKKVNGSGKGIISWKFTCGLNTPWITLGQSANNSMAATVYGDGRFVRN